MAGQKFVVFPVYELSRDWKQRMRLQNKDSNFDKKLWKREVSWSRLAKKKGWMACQLLVGWPQFKGGGPTHNHRVLGTSPDGYHSRVRKVQVWVQRSSLTHF